MPGAETSRCARAPSCTGPVRSGAAVTTQLTFGYSDSEDRVWLSLSTGRRFWMTRRMALNFLAKAAEMLEKTVPGGDIPNALPASERIALEHGEALEADLDGKPAMEVNKETRSGSPDKGTLPSPPSLLTYLTASAKGDRCSLILIPDAKDGTVHLRRIEFHRLLSALVRTVQGAGWDPRDLPDWLYPRPNR